MNRRKLIIATIIASITLFILIYSFIRTGRQSLIIQGYIEATQIDVAGKISARVENILVTEGDKVNKGNLLIQLDSPELKAKIKQAESAQQAAQAVASKAEKGLRPQEIEMAKNAWQAQVAAAKLAKDTYNRINSLYEKGLIAAQKRDEAHTNYLAQQNAANAAQQQYQMARQGAREEDKLAAQADASRVDAMLDEIASAKDEIALKAPISGEIVKVIAKVGELLPQGVPGITIVDLTDQWAVFNIQETYLKDFKVKNKFKADIPALGLFDIEFEIYYLSVLPEFATKRSVRMGRDFDINTYEVKARPTQEIADLRPGMSVIIKR